MKKLIVLIAAALTAGCATTSVTLYPPGGGTEIAGIITRGMFGSNQIEIPLDGKVYRGEWRTEPAPDLPDAKSRLHKRHVGRTHAELAAEDGSRLSCNWTFHGEKGEGVCKGPDAREYRLTTQ